MLKNQDINKHEGIYSTYEDSQITVFGIPYDGTVSFRPGTRFGPGAVRQELDGLETYSPYQDKDMTDYRICDLGDMLLPFGNTIKVIEQIHDDVTAILEDGKKTLAIGGEHLVSYPLIKAHLEKDKNLHIIHFDAHADMREDYLGEELSHATVMRRILSEMEEKETDGRIWQFGIRSGTREEFSLDNERVSTRPFNLGGLDEAIEAIGDAPVYLTIDLDVLDPSVFAGTGTPEPGGVTFNELIVALMKLQGLNLVGADLVELAPHYDQSGVSTAVACKVLREVALLMCDE